MENKNQPANPVTIHKVKGNDIETVSFPGLSKREHFAGLAMQAILSNIGCNKWNDEKIAERSVFYADKLLKQLES